MTNKTDQSITAPLPDKPVRLEFEGGEVDLLGTAHISRHSRDQVIELINSDQYDAVAVELCEKRHQAIVGDPGNLDMLPTPINTDCPVRSK